VTLLSIALSYLNCDDVQGGYPKGQVNGLLHPLFTNGRIPNGQVSRDRCNVRIIENPQVILDVLSRYEISDHVAYR
jgi:hypothetical protein